MTCKNILIVEDDEDLRSNVAEVLEVEGYCSLQAANGKEAIEILEREKQNGNLPGCILLDIMMPIMDGKQFLQEIKEKHEDILKQVGIFVWTAKGSGDGSLDKFPIEVERLKKPVEIDDLLKVVKRHCGSPD